MTFSSLAFLFVFFPAVFLLYALIRNHTARNILLAAASLVFYAFGEPVAVLIMLLSIVLNYLFGLGAAGSRRGRAAVALAVLLNIGLLVFYKYTAFLTEILNSALGLGLPVPEIRLPIGISFFTFQGLSYVIDVYRDKRRGRASTTGGTPTGTTAAPCWGPTPCWTAWAAPTTPTPTRRTPWSRAGGATWRSCCFRRGAGRTIRSSMT